MADMQEIDWFERGAVTPAKMQKGHTCWAYSVISTIESVHKLATQKLINLSEQYLFDCDKEFNNKGYGIGAVKKAFQFIMVNGGNCYSEESYKSVGYADYCRAHELEPVTTIDGFERVAKCDEAALKIAVSQQPVTAIIDAKGLSDYHHQQGIIYYKEKQEVKCNHCVVIVGFGTDEDGVDYWKCKNFWGPHWGEDGFFRIERNVRDPQGTWGIARQCYYPKKRGANMN